MPGLTDFAPALLYPASRAESNESDLTGISRIDFNYTRAGKGIEGENCGNVLYAIACSSPACKTRKNPRLAHDHCDRLTCPVCLPEVAGRMAEKIEERLLGLAGAYEDAGKEIGGLNLSMGKPKHIVFSPEQDGRGTVWLGAGRKRKRWSRDELEADGATQLLRECRRIMGEGAQDGFLGGAIILHMERKKHRGPVRDHQDATGRWVRCHDKDCQLEHDEYMDWTECEKDNCELEHRWFYGPHVHFIGYGYFQNSRDFHERTGWIYKRIQDRRERSVFLTARYQLTHSAHFDGYDGAGKVHRKQHYSFIGKFANMYGGLFITRATRTIEECEECQSPMHEYDLKPKSDDPDYDQCRGVHEVEEKEGIFYVRLDGMIYPANIRGRIEKDIAYRKEVAEWKKQYDRSVWGPDGLVLRDFTLLEGFRDPSRLIRRERSRRRRSRYEPRNVVMVPSRGRARGL